MKTTDNDQTLPVFDGRNVPVVVAAQAMGKSPMFVRVGLQNGKLPFGVAFKTDDANLQLDYYISPKQLYEYTGFRYQGENT